MRFWLCLALTACAGSSSTDTSSPPPAAAARPIAAPAVAAAPPAVGPVAVPAPGPLTAPHGSDITQLAQLDDGSAVVTADLHGGLRLWPALDGTREPVVINAPVAKALAVVHDGDGFTIAALDAAGGLHVIRTSATGAVRDRLTPPGSFSQLEATRDRLLALRTDQTIDVLGPGGKLVANLPAEPGSHVDAIVTRGTRALALVLEDRRTHGRWIDLASGAAWGKATRPLDGPVASAALSPDGTLLVINRPKSVRPVLFDLATGALRPTPTCVAKGWPKSEGFDMDEAEILREGTAPIAIGFVSDAVIACSVLTQLSWWSVNGEAVPSAGGGMLIGTSPTAVSERGVVAAMATNLGLASMIHTKFLGYGLHNVEHLYAGPGGTLAGSDAGLLELGSDLAARGRFEINRARDWTAAVPLGDRYAVVLRARRSTHPEQYMLAVFDGLAASEHQALGYDVRDPELSYEPSTRLLATSDGGNAILLPYDPATHTFGAAIRIADGNLAGKLRALDPALAGGVAALKIDEAIGGVKVSEIMAADLVPGGSVAPRRAYRVPGDLRAVDRAGRLYMREAEHGDVTVYTRGAAGAVLHGMAALNLKPNADGSLIAATDPPRVVLLAATGAVRWDVQHWNSAELDWLADGGLIAQFATGVATLDLATGSLTRRRCGWSFGLSEQPFDQAQGLASLCDARAN